MYFWRHDVDHIPPVLPCLRLIDDLGEVVPGAAAAVPEIADEEALMIQKTMVRQSEFDKIFNEAQRQGRVAFYLTSRGEEACAVASAAALGDADWILPQYREMGAALWRGMTFEQIANQCTANAADGGKGRQLGLHIGDKSKHYLYVKSPLGTHLPQAAGAAYLSRLLKEAGYSAQDIENMWGDGQEDAQNVSACMRLMQAIAKLGSLAQEDFT